MKTKVLVILLIISLGFNLGIVLNFILNGRRTEPAEYSWHCANLRERFNLTPEQARILEAKRMEMQKKTQSIRDNLRSHRLELLRRLNDELADTMKLDSLLRTIAFSQYEIEKYVLMHMCEVRGILDDNQRLQFDKQMEDNLCPHNGHGCFNRHERR